MSFLPCLLGFFTGAIYMPGIAQLSLGNPYDNSMLQALTFFLFPLSWLALAAGSLCSKEISPQAGHFLRAALILTFLFACLLIPLRLTSSTMLVLRDFACALPLALFYLTVGLELGNEGQRDRKNSQGGHYVYGCFLLFTVVGGIFSDQVIQYVGGNALLLLLAAFSLSCAWISNRWTAAAVAGFAV